MERALTASSFSTPIDACLDHHPVANHHRDVAVPQIRPVSRRRPEAIAALVLLMPSTPIGVFAGRVSRFALFRVVQPSVFAGHSSFCSGFDSAATSYCWSEAGKSVWKRCVTCVIS